MRVRDHKIVVDVKGNTVVVPVMSRPFRSISTRSRTASVNDEENSGFSSEINFLSPGQGVGRKDDQPFEDASAHFIPPSNLPL